MELSEDTRKLINDTLKVLVDVVHKESGMVMLIGYGMYDTDAEVFIEGAVGSSTLRFKDAAIMMLGINGYVSDWFGYNGNEKMME